MLTRWSCKTMLKGLSLHDAEEKEGKEAQPCVRQQSSTQGAFIANDWQRSTQCGRNFTGWKKENRATFSPPPISNSAQSKPQHTTPGSTRSDAWVGFHAFNVHILSWESQIPSSSCHLAISSSYCTRLILVTEKKARLRSALSENYTDFNALC